MGKGKLKRVEEVFDCWYAKFLILLFLILRNMRVSKPLPMSYANRFSLPRYLFSHSKCLYWLLISRFESGSMPYASQHYPFENKQELEASFPGDFIAEGLDQTRGWFYTLLVLGTRMLILLLLFLIKIPRSSSIYGFLIWPNTDSWILDLFGKSPFKNCVVNGIVLAEDGKIFAVHRLNIANRLQGKKCRSDSRTTPIHQLLWVNMARMPCDFTW